MYGAYRRSPRPPRHRGRYAVAAIVLLVLVVAGALVLVAVRASVSGDSSALAKVSLPLGGKIESVSVVTGPHSGEVPVQLRGERIWPRGLVGTHQVVSIEVVVKRAGWISWLAGSTQRLRLTLTTPNAHLRDQFLTLASGAPLRIRFDQPVAAIAYGQPGQIQRRVLRSAQSAVTLERISQAGSMLVGGAPRTWETSPPSVVSWFPAGAAAGAVANPSPGSTIGPETPITLTFSKPVSQALGSSMPALSPAGVGSWRTVNSHTIAFQPQGYGYGLGATVSLGLPGGVKLVGSRTAAASGTWRVQPGSTVRLQQLLAGLGYLPLRFHYGGAKAAPTPQAQEAAAIDPPRGTFTWRYGNVPSALRSMWAPGANGPMTQGALMAFENDHGLNPDGDAGPVAWRALIGAALAGHRSTFGYSFVTVNRESSPQSLTLWHNGRTVVTTEVNTGIASAPTDSGTFPVYEHIRVGTMSGNNPDGSHYSDPGIQFISYFNGGDALHAFDRSQFGFAQSLGCVEMALGPAGQVWPDTPVGSLVHVV